MSTGFVLNIPQEMINRLDLADQKIEKLAKTSEDAQTRIVSAFKSINTHGIDAFINKLTEAQNAIQGLSNVELNIKSGGFEGVKRGVAEVSNELQKLNELQEKHRQKSEEIAAAEKIEEERLANKAKIQKQFFEAKAKYEAEAAKLDAMPLPWGGESFEDTIKRYEKALKAIQKAIKETSDPQESEKLSREIEFRKEELKILKSIRAEEDAIEKTRQRYRSQRQNIVEPLHQQYMQAGDALENDEALRRQEKGLYNLRGELSKIEYEIEKAEAAYGRSVILGGKQQGVVQTPVSAVSEQSTVAIDAINKLIDAINKLHSIQGKGAPSSSSNSSTMTDAEKERKAYVETYEMYKRMFDQIERKRVAKEKAAEKEAKAAEASAEREARAAEKAAERERKAYEKAYKERAKQYQEANRKQLNTYGGAMEFSQNAHTINRMVQSIKYLQSARDALSNTDSQYTQKVKALNDEIKRQKSEIDKVRNGAKELQKEHRSLMDISGQLARRLALVFSVSQITGYVKKLIEVRGEFELQQRSLQAILQNKDEANRIWQQTVDLAVRSPFRVKELVSYTKQLAAYRIESDKLFETNKMLADISAGLGVDMQRLILAFGQVRSAAYLRGTELRQFTEAGIPILEQLAQYFTELEGRAVSVGDVFERVSKRMVSFADVEEIFKRMTSEGGTFYRMQEIQAETLQGQISNLKDSVDIMLNDIGKAHQDTLASSVAFVRSIVQNWRLLATAIQQAGFALAGFSAVKIIRALRLTGDALVEATVKARGLTAATAKLKLSMMDLGKWIKAHPAFFAVGLIASATHALIQYGKSVDAMNEKYDEMSQRELRRVDTLKELNEQAEKNNQAIKDAIAEQDNASEGTNEYATAEDNLSKARGKNIALLERLKKEYPEVYASITKQEDGTVDLTKAIEEQNRVAQRQIALQQQAKGGWFQESLTKNYEDAVEALGNYQSSLDKVAIATYEMRQNLSMALSSEQITQEEYDVISGIADQMMDIKDSVKGFNLIEEIFGTKAMSNAEISALVEPIRHALVELGETVPEYNWALGDFFDNLENLKSLPVTINEMVALDPDKGKKNAGDYVESVLDEFGIVNDTIREWAKRKIEKIIGFKLVWGDGEGGGGDDELDGWAKRVKEAVDALNEEIKKKSPEIDADDLFPVPNKNQTKEEYLAVAKDAIGVAEMTYNELQKIEDQEVVDRTKALSPFVETFRKILNLYKETQRGGGDRDTFTPMLRTVKEIYQEFKKLQGSFDDLTAKEGALAKFGDAFKEAFGKTPEQMGFDLFSEEGVKKAYDYIISKAPDAKKRIQAKLAKGEIVWDVKLQKKEDADKQLLDDIQELFDRYDLSLELKKLNIPTDLAKSLFDVDYLDLEGLRKAVVSQKSEFVGRDMLKEYDELMKKIGDLQRKQREEEAKEFINFLKKNLNEIQVIQDKGAYNIALADRLFGEGKITAEQYMSSIRQIVDDTNKETSRISLEKFKESPQYIQAMGDMAAYTTEEIRTLIKSLEDVVAANSDAFSADEAKAYIDAIYKAQETLDELEQSPFRWEEVAKIGDILETEKEIETQKEEKIRLQEQEKKQLEELARLEEKLKRLQEEKSAILSGEGDLKSKADRLAFVQSDIDTTTQAIKTGQHAVASTQSQAKTTETILGKLGDKMKSLTGKGGGAASTVAIIDAIINGINDTVQGILDITNEIGSVMESFGKETDMSTGFGKFQKGFAIFAESSQHAADGWNALKSGDPVGAVVSVVKSVTSLIRGINEYKDAELQVEIDKQAEQVERLGKAYEKLEQSTEKAYSIEQLQKANTELERNVELQIASYKAMIAAENAKKNTDTEQIAAWNEELEALTKQWEDLKDSLLEGVGGVAESNFRSQTREFVDSWVSAFKETGNGLSGLKENFREFFDNIIAEQASLRVTEKFLAPFYESLSTALDDLRLSVGESKDLREEADRIMPELSKALELIWNELGGSRGEVGGAGLSGLTKGIQGITEDQADILAAYWNSVRGYTASIDSKMDLVLANLGAGAEENPMLEQIRLVAKNTSAINTLLNSLVKGGHPQGGQGLKVFMD